MTQPLGRRDHGRSLPESCRDRQSAARAIAVNTTPVLLLLFFFLAKPLQGQGQGEVQVTARVLPVEPARDAAIAVAATPGVPSEYPLFRIRRVDLPGTISPGRDRHDELILIVEFLAN
jgi:hypothetical protein